MGIRICTGRGPCRPSRPLCGSMMGPDTSSVYVPWNHPRREGCRVVGVSVHLSPLIPTASAARSGRRHPGRCSPTAGSSTHPHSPGLRDRRRSGSSSLPSALSPRVVRHWYSASWLQKNGRVFQPSRQGTAQVRTACCPCWQDRIGSTEELVLSSWLALG